MLGWRDRADRARRAWARPRSAPCRSIEQVFLAPAARGACDTMALERRAFVLRKRVEHAVDGLYFPSLSARTIVYKGMLTSEQLRQFFPDLRDPRFESGPGPGALALLDQHLPELAAGPPVPLHGPQRRDQHAGRQPQLDAGPRGAARDDAHPRRPRRGSSRSARPAASDSASFDEVLELLHLGGRSLPHAVLMMIPEAWENHATMDRDRRAFYRYHASLMEPWDGPAAVALHRRHRRRRGARPQRPAPGPLLGHRRRAGGHGLRGGRARHRPRDASCARAASSRAACSWSTRPRAGIVDDEEIKAELAAEHPYAEWLADRPGPPRRAAAPGPCSRPSTAASSPSSACSATPPRSCG